MASVLNLTYHSESGRYTITDTAHTALQSLNGSLDFRIGAGIHSDPATIIKIPYKAFDLEASWPIFNTTTRYFPLRKTANRTEYALGRVFLQDAYLVVDWERDVAELSQAVFSDPMPEPNLITIHPPNSSINASFPVSSAGSAGLPAASIAGLAIGIGLLVIAVASVLRFWLRIRGQDTAKRHPGVLRLLQAHGRQGPSELAYQARVELETTPVRPEMYAPPKPHELGSWK